MKKINFFDYSKHLLPVAVITFLVIIFFWKFFLKGFVPFPGDLLVGAYYPWLEYKWGYIAGVPIKNGLISDVFSEIYIWKHLAMEGLKISQWPLWNPYSYSGYPLLANFSSGALYFLNSLLVFGVKGWSAMIIIQVLGAGLASYGFLILRKYPQIPAIAGAIAFAFSSSMMGRLEWNSAGHVLMWLASSLFLLEYYFEKNRRAIIFLPLTIFFLVTAGHFQTMFYSLFIIGLYSVYKLSLKKKTDYLIELVVFSLIGVALSAIQFLPTISMMNKSIRFSEAAIGKDNFGLLPLGNLITMIAPDFFGNPTTGNFWGFLNYSETIFYPGILGVISLLWASFNFKKLSSFSKFILFLGLGSILLAFDNPVGRLVYQLKVPFISTGYAARIAVLLVFSEAVLIAEWLKNLPLMKTKEATLPFFVVFSGISISFLISLYGTSVFNQDPTLTGQWLANMAVANRNLILPLIITGGYALLVLLRKQRFVLFFFLLLIAADLFRYGWKYNPFVTPEFVYPKTEVTDFLMKQPGLFRVESQRGPILPAQTWAMYGLSSPAGYDPLVGREYAFGYAKLLNNSDGATRYSTLGRYVAKDLGEFNVKYLLIDKEFSPLGKTSLMSWDKAFETGKIIVYQNKEFKERIEWTGKGRSDLSLEQYSPNKIKISFSADSDGEVIVRDSWDSGWKAWVNGKPENITKYNNIFRSVKTPSGSGEIVMEYSPGEWEMGKKIFVGAGLIWIIAILYIIKQRKHE